MEVKCNWGNGRVRQLDQSYRNVIREISSIVWKCNWGNEGGKELVQVYGNEIDEMR